MSNDSPHFKQIRSNSIPKAEASCLHFQLCSGCSEDLSCTSPAVWQEVLQFFHEKITPTLHQAAPFQWRHRAKLAVRGSPNQPLIGLFKRGSHEVEPIPGCLVHHPKLNQAFEIVRRWMKKLELMPYQEESGQGDLRYLQGVVQRKTGLVQLTCVLNTANSETAKAKKWQKLLLQLAQEYSSLWHSIWLNFNDRPTNTIFGPQAELVWGEEWLWESFGKIEVCYGPLSFGQANLPLFEQLLENLRAQLPKEARLAEFYAGVGAIGLFVADICRWVRCSEINPHAAICFEKSKQRLLDDVKDRLSFFSASTEKSLDILRDANVAIVDPPRKGLDACLFDALKHSSVEQLLYISCGWPAFKRDCEKLLQQGWIVRSVDGYFFFPGSNHIELLVNFTRKVDF